LVLATVRESARRSLFHLGEVLVTEAKVRVAGVPGLGLIQGRDPEAALDLATIDAAWSARLPMVPEWIVRLEAEEAALEARLDREQASLATTRVEFETLDQREAP
jgi:alpha-D-ribose 1-methylphosphonate 5-triphosphate synthase subunit PhnG